MTVTGCRKPPPPPPPPRAPPFHVYKLIRIYRNVNPLNPILIRHDSLLMKNHSMLCNQFQQLSSLLSFYTPLSPSPPPFSLFLSHSSLFLSPSLSLSSSKMSSVSFADPKDLRCKKVLQSARVFNSSL